MMKYSMNYYSKKNLEINDTYNQVPGILESFINREKKRSIAVHSNKELSRYEFVVPWQLP